VKTAVIILFHGSRADGSAEIARTIAERAQKRGGYDFVTTAFLQNARPGLNDAISDSAAHHVDKIVVVPFFLQLGMHVTKDIPALLNESRHQHPWIKIELTRAVGAHPRMVDIVIDLVEQIQQE
jgi:sirohydrochlorin ferrochelatase